MWYTVHKLREVQGAGGQRAGQMETRPSRSGSLPRPPSAHGSLCIILCLHRVCLEMGITRKYTSVGHILAYENSRSHFKALGFSMWVSVNQPINICYMLNIILVINSNHKVSSFILVSFRTQDNEMSVVTLPPRGRDEIPRRTQRCERKVEF